VPGFFLRSFKMPERAEFTFTVKEFVSGTPWILAEQISGPEILERCMLGFDLAAGTTLEQAHEIAAYMRRHISGLHITP
jgi:hypothetical protein